MASDLGPVELVSVNVSLPKYLGEHRGTPVMSGIAKVPVTQRSSGSTH